MSNFPGAWVQRWVERLLRYAMPALLVLFPLHCYGQRPATTHRARVAPY